jgi:hypothetical protein
VVIVGSEGFIYLYLILIICTVQYLYDPSLVKRLDSLSSSVGYLDPEPDPHDLHVFGPPGSGFISQSHGSGFGSFPFLVKVLRGLK